MANISVVTVSTTIDDSAEARARSLERLRFHRSVLEQSGITDLGELGTLQLAGSVAAHPGIVQAPPQAPTSSQPPILTLPALPPRWSLPRPPIPILRLQTDGTAAQLAPSFAESPTLPAGALFHPLSTDVSSTSRSLLVGPAPSLNLNVAYFVGQRVSLAAGTVVVLDRPNLFLTFIAEDLQVGPNVTFTFEHPLPPSAPVSWAVGDRPPKPGKAPTPDGLWGVTGAAGERGQDGGAGFSGVDAPEIELWALTMSGAPIFDLRGQDGWPGGRGRDGGEGGDGSDGRAERYDFLGFCASGAGPGGDGGPGGSGGHGGPGGPGGHGGRLRFYAPRDVLSTYAAGGFRITTDGGSGGPGGGPGSPGAGGRGGLLGPRPKNCAMSTQRHDGAPGAQGAQGLTGTPGPTGGAHADAVAFLPITASDFREELTKPALISANPAQAAAGTPVTLSTLRVQASDELLLDGDPIPMTVVADTLATFVLPAAVGGQRILQIRQADGTLSNRLSFYVLPQLAAVGDGSRQRPGHTVSVTGTGFAPDARVRVNGEDMADTVFVNQSTMTFTLRRPVATVDNPSGETGHCTVILADGTPSNEIDFIIDTMLFVVVGDSVAWGQGLRPHEKISSLVEAALAAAQGGIKCYTTTLAHSGAIIGVGDTTTLDPINGEVPTSYPTVLQQITLFTGDPAAVDLVLVSSGLNDLNVRTVLNPFKTPKDFAPALRRACHTDTKTLLRTIAGTFPNATIVTTGYFPFISDDSDTGLITALLVAAGVAVASLPGGILTGGLIAQIVTNSRAFYDLSTLALRSAVEDVNDDLPTPRILFADAGFQPTNAALASQPWLYGINADLSPQDRFTAGDRSTQCTLNAARTDVAQCIRASIGHPNPAGAQAYANAITAALATGPAPTDTTLPPFPPGFLLGVATAAMQNEGGITNNDWAAFTTSPAIRARVANIITKGGGTAFPLAPPGDAIKHSDPTTLAADLDLAAGLGINAYRFSVEWARLAPNPPTHAGDLTDADLDTAALNYYDSVLDALTARGMTPVLTLNHLSLPLWVLDPPRNGTLSPASLGGIEVATDADPNFQGSLRGWENPQTVDEFLRLTRYLANRWAHRITWWVTLNEPVGSMIGAGYFAGVWPPGFTGDAARGKTAYFNLIRAHLRAYEAIKAAAPSAMIGIAHAMLHAKTTTQYRDDLIGDQDAARNQFDYFYNWHILDTIVNGHIDTAIHRRPGNRQYLEGIDFATDMGINPNQPWTAHCDYIGINYYRSVYVYASLATSFAIPYTGGLFDNNLDGKDQVHQLLNPLGWEINPSGLRALLEQVHANYGLPILITENGIPQPTDRTRAPFITAHLTEILAAISAGVDVRGYLHWTLADNWEWQEGYRPEAHFGLLTVDRADPTMPRQLTEGAEAYASAVTLGGVRGARDRFGTVSSGGDQVRPPKRSPAFVTGTLDGQPFELSLRIADHQISGLLWEPDAVRLLRLTGSYDPASAALHLTHGPGKNITAGSLIGQLTNGPTATTLSGIASRNSASVAWSGTVDPLVGQWVGPGPLTRIGITRTPGGPSGYTGGALAETLPGGWEPLTVAGDASATITIATGQTRVSVTTTGNQLTGTVTADNTTSPWSATRLPGPFD